MLLWRLFVVVIEVIWITVKLCVAWPTACFVNFQYMRAAINGHSKTCCCCTHLLNGWERVVGEGWRVKGEMLLEMVTFLTGWPFNYALNICCRTLHNNNNTGTIVWFFVCVDVCICSCPLVDLYANAYGGRTYIFRCTLKYFFILFVNYSGYVRDKYWWKIRKNLKLGCTEAWIPSPVHFF